MRFWAGGARGREITASSARLCVALAVSFARHNKDRFLHFAYSPY
jgi:hypothetical protein